MRQEVKLKATGLGFERSFELILAEKMMRKDGPQGKKVWELPDNSKYEFDGVNLKIKKKKEKEVDS